MWIIRNFYELFSPSVDTKCTLRTGFRNETEKYISTRNSKKVDMHTFVDSVADELVYCIINVIMKKNWPRKLCKTLTNFI